MFLHSILLSVLETGSKYILRKWRIFRPLAGTICGLGPYIFSFITSLGIADFYSSEMGNKVIQPSLRIHVTASEMGN